MEPERAGQERRRAQPKNNVGTSEEGRDNLGYANIKSEPAGILDSPRHTDHQTSLCSESDTDDSEDWRETSYTQTDSKSVENPNVQIKAETDDADHKSLIYSGRGKKCSSKAGLTRRKKSCRGPLTCSLCGNRFETRRKLSSHMRIHSQERPFICSQCGKCYSQRCYLTRHMRAHTGEKPFSCSQCGKSFPEKGKLKEHTRVHTGEKPFNCSLCGKCFSKKVKLNDHMRVHTGEKPFNCSQCGKCFAAKGTLNRHIKSHIRKTLRLLSLKKDLSGTIT
ncbi:uncharacterized protein ACB058_012613 isoform 2-T2 [Synchiropus picturatus]